MVPLLLLLLLLLLLVVLLAMPLAISGPGKAGGISRRLIIDCNHCAVIVVNFYVSKILGLGSTRFMPQDFALPLVQQLESPPPGTKKTGTRILGIRNSIIPIVPIVPILPILPNHTIPPLHLR